MGIFMGLLQRKEKQEEIEEIIELRELVKALNSAEKAKFRARMFQHSPPIGTILTKVQIDGSTNSQAREIVSMVINNFKDMKKNLKNAKRHGKKMKKLAQFVINYSGKPGYEELDPKGKSVELEYLIFNEENGVIKWIDEFIDEVDAIIGEANLAKRIQNTLSGDYAQSQAWKDNAAVRLLQAEHEIFNHSISFPEKLDGAISSLRHMIVQTEQLESQTGNA